MLNFDYTNNRNVIKKPANANIMSAFGALDTYTDEELQAIEIVEGVTCIDRYRSIFKSKFNSKHITVEQLSTGARVILTIFGVLRQHKEDDVVVNITGCGRNAINYILNTFKNTRLNLICYHTDFAGGELDKEKVKFNGEESSVKEVRSYIKEISI